MFWVILLYILVTGGAIVISVVNYKTLFNWNNGRKYRVYTKSEMIYSICASIIPVLNIVILVILYREPIEERWLRLKDGELSKRYQFWNSLKQDIEIK